MYDLEARQLVDHLEDSEIPVDELIEISLRISQRETGHALSNDYIVYLNESDNHIGQ